MFISVKGEHVVDSLNPKFIKAMFVHPTDEGIQAVWVVDSHYVRHEVNLDSYGLSEASQKDAKTVMELVKMLQEDC